MRHTASALWDTHSPQLLPWLVSQPSHVAVTVGAALAGLGVTGPAVRSALQQHCAHALQAGRTHSNAMAPAAAVTPEGGGAKSGQSSAAPPLATTVHDEWARLMVVMHRCVCRWWWWEGGEYLGAAVAILYFVSANCGCELGVNSDYD